MNLLAIIQTDPAHDALRADYEQATGWLANTVEAVLKGEMGLDALGRAKADFDAAEQALADYGG
jgi:hypothetical protein